MLGCFMERVLGTYQFLYLLHLMVLVVSRSLNASRRCIDGVRYAWARSTSPSQVYIKLATSSTNAHAVRRRLGRVTLPIGDQHLSGGEGLRLIW